MSKLYLITGPAGVGKSTISKMVADSLVKSVLIEGDDIYNMVRSSYVSPWLEGNHLEIFWQNSISLIDNYLKGGYDVVFNYIITKENLVMLKESFKEYEVKFIVLMCDEKTIVERDKKRPLGCQMGERSLALLKDFKDMNYDSKYILDTTDMSVDDIVKLILGSNKYIE